MKFVLTNIEVFVVIVLLNKPKGTNTENYLREYKAARTSLAKLECAILKLNENEYTIHGFETRNHIFYDTLSQEAGSAAVILNSVSIHINYNIIYWSVTISINFIYTTH